MFKRVITLIILAVTLFQISSCASLGFPPGQAKKITGEKDASRHAPGKNK